MNNNGQAVGSTSSHAILWTAQAGTVDLNTRIRPNSGWVLKTATAINDRGQIVGTGTLNGQPRAFLLVQEQRTVVDVAVGATDGKTRLLLLSDDAAASVDTIGPGRSTAGGDIIESSLAFGPFPGWRPAALAWGSNDRGRLLWVNEQSGAAAIWFLLADGTPAGGTEFGPIPGWRAVDVSQGTYDGKTRLLWRRQDGAAAAVWVIGEDGTLESGYQYGPFAGWTPVALATGGGNNQSFLLWQHTGSGTASLWQLSASGAFERGQEHGPFAGWIPVGIGAGGIDGGLGLLWQHQGSSRVSLWAMSSISRLDSGFEYGPFEGWSPVEMALGGLSAGQSTGRLLWKHTGDKRISLWQMSPAGAFQAGQEFYP